MIQEFNGPVQYAAGRDVVVIQVRDPLTPEECEMVLGYRAAPDEVRREIRQRALAAIAGRVR